MKDKSLNIVREISILSAFVLGTLALAYFGFAEYLAGKNFSTGDYIYFSLQLFTLQFNVLEAGRRMPAALEFARFAAPLLSSYAATRALMEIFAEPIQAFRVAHLEGHTVVCGLGQKGFELCRDLCSRGEDVVVVEWNKENDWIETCRDLGARIVLGDANEKLILKKAAVENARALFVVCDEDAINVDIGLLAQSMATRHAGRQPLAIYLHVENLKLNDLLRRSGLNERKKAGARIRVFNIHENAARHVLQANPLDGAGLSPDDQRHPHLVLIGFGRMGETLLLHAVQSGQYANGKKLRVTAIDRAMKQRNGPFQARYPGLSEVCIIEFWNEDYEGPAVAKALDEFAHDPGSLLTVAVCLPEDGQSLAAALRVAEIFRERNVPILVRLERDGGLAELARGERDHSISLIKPFITGGSFVSEKSIADKDRNKLAKAIHEDRRAHALNDENSPAWADLDEETRDVCRQAADHVEIKLRACGCRSVHKPHETQHVEEFHFSSTEAELLASMEHQRWRAALILSGYKLGETPGGVKDPIRKLHPQLKDWKDVPEVERAKARALAVRIPTWLGMIGKQVQRVAVEKN